MRRLVLSSLFGFVLFSYPSFALEVLPKKPDIPKNNPQTKAKITLGKILYFDPRLSKDHSVSCNTCHDVMGSGTDNLPTSKGINNQFGGRNAPTVWNAAFQSVQFWDGRAKTLEEQAVGPITNPIEMGMDSHDFAVDRIKNIKGYEPYFTKAFGKNSITIDNVGKAIAAYERTLITPNSPVDRYLKGNKKALNQTQVAGMKLFQTVGCLTCHSGPNYSGPKLPMGQGFYMKFPLIAGSEYDKKYDLKSDLGRYEHTKKEEDKHLYRVPTLRNIARTAPYFHNGKVKSLEEAVRVMGKTQLGRDFKNTEVKQIAAFLKGLNGRLPKQTKPALPQ